MPKFSKDSLEQLKTCKAPLQLLFMEVVKHFDCTYKEGARTPERQQELLDSGLTETLDSKHIPLDMDDGYDEDGFSEAGDVYPYPIRIPDPDSPDYAKDLARYYYFGGYVKGIARAMGIPIRWGGDWDDDTEVNDQNFDDLVHFELKED